VLPQRLGCLLAGDVVKWFTSAYNPKRTTARVGRSEFVTIPTSAAEVIRRAPKKHHIRIVRLYQKRPQQALELARSLS